MAREVQASALVRVLVHWRRCWYGGAAVCVWFCFLSVPDLLAMAGSVLGSIRGLVSRHYAKTIVGDRRPVRWLVSGLVWAGWCWLIVRGKHCWLAGLGWLKPISEQRYTPRRVERGVESDVHVAEKKRQRFFSDESLVSSSHACLCGE